METISEDEIKKQVSALKTVLPEIDEQCIDSELRKYLDKYLLPLENAKYATLRSFNSSDEAIEALESVISEDEITAFRDLQVGMPDVTLSCFIAYVNPYNITVRGEPKTIFKGELIGDGIPIRVTFWDDFKIEPDSHVFLTHMKVDEFKGEMTVQSTRQTRVIIQND